MKKYVYQGISLVLVLTMSTWCLSGCGSDTARKDTGENQVQAEKTEEHLEKLLSGRVGDGSNAEKKETVFVELDADGSVKNTIVSDVLKVSGKENIRDISNLQQIENLNGDEKFTAQNGELIWENKGENITYQGTTTESTPVGVQITYYLDGKERSPEQLAGKSGKIKMVYHYINDSEREGKFVPFLMLTGMVLGENFTNVEVNQGKVLDYDDTKIVIGYGAPGLKDYLISRVKNGKEYMKDIDIPESFTVEADVENFEMDMALTVATSDMGDMDLEEALDFSDVSQQMDELENGTEQLEEGAENLQSGAGQLMEGADKVDDGAKNVAKYMSDLYLGTTRLLTNYKTFNKALIGGVKSADNGAKKLYKGTQNIKTASKELDDGAKAINSGAKDLNNAAIEIDNGADTLSEGLNNAKAAFEDVTDSSGAVKSQGLNNGAKALAEGAEAAGEGVEELAESLQSTPDSIQAQIDDVIKQITQATGGAISSETALNDTVESIHSAVSKGMELETVLQANNLNTESYFQLSQAYYSIQTLKAVKSALEEQIDSKKSEIKSLLDGMNSLETGASRLNQGVNTLYNGIVQLNQGAAALAQGTGQLTEGTGTLSKGTKTLSGGTGKLKTGANTLNKGMKSLAGGTKQMKNKLGSASTQVQNGIETVDGGAERIKEGAQSLAQGTGELDFGIVTLFDGTKTLKEGVVKLNKEGISKITQIFGKDAEEAIESVQEVLNNGKEYQSFSGINENMTGSVKFIFKTGEIKSDK